MANAVVMQIRYRIYEERPDGAYDPKALDDQTEMVVLKSEDLESAQNKVKTAIKGLKSESRQR